MTTETFHPRDFVYCGRRRDHTGKMSCEVRVVLNAELGTLSPEQLYPWKREHRLLVVGGIHTGAEFSNDKARGLADAAFKELWPVEQDRLAWKARDESAEVRERTDKLHGDARRRNEIAEIIAPLRKTYNALLERGDVNGAAALSAAILRALTKRPTEKEQQP